LLAHLLRELLLRSSRPQPYLGVHETEGRARQEGLPTKKGARRPAFGISRVCVRLSSATHVVFYCEDPL